MRLQRLLMRLLGMLQGLPGTFPARQMVLFLMMLRGDAMRMCRKIVKFSSSPM